MANHGGLCFVKMLQCCIAVGPVVRHLALPSMQLCYEFVLFSKWFSICQFPFPHGFQFVTFPMVPSCSFLSGSQSAPFHVAPNLVFSLWFQNCPFPSGAKFVIFEAVINLPGPFTSSPCWSALCFSRFPNRSHLRALDSQGGKGRRTGCGAKFDGSSHGLFHWWGESDQQMHIPSHGRGWQHI